MSSHTPPLPPEPGQPNRLREAVRCSAAPGHLSAQVRRHLERECQQPVALPWLRTWVPVAALLVLGIAGAVWYRAGHRGLVLDPAEVESASLLQNVSLAMRAGLDNHLHCSVYGGNPVPDRLPAMAEAAQGLAPQFRELLSVVERRVPPQFRIYSAHECRRQGRKFVHLQLKADQRLLSVIVTRRGAGQSFEKDKAILALAGAGTSIYQARSLRFQLAALETRDYVAYVVSDLAEQDNLIFMTSIAPELRQALERLQS